MKDQIQFETNGLTVLAVPVPEDSDRFKVFNDDRPYLSYFVKHNTSRIYIESGNWTLHAVTTDMTEEQAKVLVDEPLKSPHHDRLGYMVDCMDTEIYSTAKECFDSILSYHGIDQAQKWVLLIKG